MYRPYLPENLKKELNKLRHLAPERKVQGKKGLTYSDIIWFLIKEYKKTH